MERKAAPPILLWITEALLPDNKPLAGYRNHVRLSTMSDTDITCYAKAYMSDPMYIGFDPSVLKGLLDTERTLFGNQGSLLYHIIRTVCDWLGVPPELTVSGSEARIGGMLVAERKGADFVEDKPADRCAAVQPLSEVMKKEGDDGWFYSGKHQTQLNPAQLSALTQYTINSSKFNLYYLIKTLLGPDEAEKVFGTDVAQQSVVLYEGLTQAIQAVRPVNENHPPFTVFRATNYFPVDKEHSLLSKPKPFMLLNSTACSTTILPMVAYSFLANRSCCMFKLTVPPEYTSYVSLHNISMYSGEREVLLPPGVGFLVEDVSYHRRNGRILTVIRATLAEPEEAARHPDTMVAVDSTSFSEDASASVIASVYSSVSGFVDTPTFNASIMSSGLSPGSVPATPRGGAALQAYASVGAVLLILISLAVTAVFLARRK